MILALVGILVIVAVVAVVMVILDGNDTQPHSSGRIIEPEERRYGRHGEEIATDAIIEYLREDDALYTNVPVSYGEQRSELDNVITTVLVVSITGFSAGFVGVLVFIPRVLHAEQMPEIRHSHRSGMVCHKLCGDGRNGTCVRYVIDCTCPNCGEQVKAWTCHYCG